MRWWLFGGVGVAVLIVGVAARFAIVRASRTTSPHAVAGRGHWQTAWTLPLPGAVDVSLAPTGDSVGWTDDKGSVRRILSESGRTLWRTTPLTGVNRVLVAATGAVAAFSGLNPERNSVVFLSARGGDQKSRVFAGDGAVWSAAFGPDGAAFVGTGGHIIYPAGEVGTGGARFRLQGMPESLAVSTDGSRLAVGTWFPGAVVCCAPDTENSCWQQAEPEPDRSCRVAISSDGSRVMVLSTRGAKGTDGMLRVHDGETGRLLWKVSLPDHAISPGALLSDDGGFVAVTYLRSASEEDADDWRLAYFNADGRRVFADKGSALFKPRIAAIAADGSTITVRSGDDTLFTLDARGNFISQLHLTPDVRTGKSVVVEHTESSRDGKTLLLRRRDGQVTLLHAG